MGTVVAPAEAREASIEVTVIRADGRIERLGTVSYWHRNPLRRLAWRLFGWRG
jgi:hypothetical protein